MTAFAHQKKSIAHSAKTNVVYDCSDPGCVSAETEFLTPFGWKRIDRYLKGDLVAQFHPNEREVEFVLPLAYIKKPCSEMIHIAPARGTSQQLSPEHRVLYYREDGTNSVCSATEFMEGLHALGPARHARKFCSTFSIQGRSGLDMSEENLRLMVAVIADGHFNCQSARCVIRLKKDRKVSRLRQLLAKAQMDYSVRICGSQPDFTVFTFYAPRREKEFTSWWWGASQSQLETIADELPHWDSAISPRPSKGIRFASNSMASAEFAQFAFSAAKHPTSIKEEIRFRHAQGRGTEIMYTVHA